MHTLQQCQNVLCFSDETNFAYIIEALQVKKPPTPPTTTSTLDPPPVLSACCISDDSASETVQSVKELFPHLEISQIEVYMIIAVCPMCFLEFNC